MAILANGRQQLRSDSLAILKDNTPEDRELREIAFKLDEPANGLPGETQVLKAALDYLECGPVSRKDVEVCREFLSRFWVPDLEQLLTNRASENVMRAAVTASAPEPTFLTSLTGRRYRDDGTTPTFALFSKRLVRNRYARQAQP